VDPLGHELLVSAWPESPNAISEGKPAGARGGVRGTLAFDGTERENCKAGSLDLHRGLRSAFDRVADNTSAGQPEPLFERCPPQQRPMPINALPLSPTMSAYRMSGGAVARECFSLGRIRPS